VVSATRGLFFFKKNHFGVDVCSKMAQARCAFVKYTRVGQTILQGVSQSQAATGLSVLVCCSVNMIVFLVCYPNMMVLDSW
jgi:hypothetical protein